MTMHMRGSSLETSTDPTSYSATDLHLRGAYRTLGKRGLDLLLVALLALPALCLVLPLAWMISRDGKSPFFIQERLGRNGDRFWIWKLRSMTHDADTALEAHLAAHPEAREEWDRTQKLRDDPRITPVGRFIRKTSIDELPQLLNVLRGDMSMIGPRPMMVCQEALYPGTAYYAMRPGITGPWQTSARNATSFSERAQYDTTYLREMSLATDVALIGRTILVVLKGTGC